MRWERCINITADTERLFIKTLHNWVMYSTASFIDAQNALTLSKHAYHTWSYHWAFSSSEGDGEEMEREREGEREGDRERWRERERGKERETGREGENCLTYIFF